MRQIKNLADDQRFCNATAVGVKPGFLPFDRRRCRASNGALWTI